MVDKPKWQEIDTEYDFQVMAWRNTDSRRVLAVEEQVEPDYDEPKYQVFLLDEEWLQNPLPLSQLGLHDDQDDAVAEAEDYMESHASA